MPRLDLTDPRTFAQQRAYFRPVLRSLERFRADCAALEDYVDGHDADLAEHVRHVLFSLRVFAAMLGDRSPPGSRPTR